MKPILKSFLSRKFWAYATAGVVIPILALLLIEFFLRLAGYGYSPDFFVRQTIEGKEFYVNNHTFSWRFFPRPAARLSASLRVPVVKEKNALRVFVVGESAAMGDPDPAFSFSRMLEAMVEGKYPDRKIEVYNTAVTAINSNVIVPLVKDCMKLEPDLFVVYMGNNEVVGPYGLSATLTPFFSRRAVIKTQVWLSSTRIGQWAASLSRHDDALVDWKGMEAFARNSVAHDHPDLAKINSHFRSNLNEICVTATQGGAKVILSTIITNQQHCAPFLSLHRKNLDSAALIRWDKAFGRGVSFQAAHQYRDALKEFLKADVIDEEYAELNFRIATCLVELKDDKTAKEYFIRARDLDALRFRADSNVNEIIRQIAIVPDDDIYLADAALTADANHRHGVAGHDLLYEHVHLNPAGNYLLARDIGRQMELALGLHSVIGQTTIDVCHARLGFTAFDTFRMTQTNLSRIEAPPFTEQYTHTQDVAGLKNRIDSVQKILNHTFVTKTKAKYDSLLTNHPADWFVRLNYLKLLHHFDFYEEAHRQAEALHALLPYEYLSFINLGITNRSLKKYSKAADWFEQAMAINPYFSEAYKNMAALYEEQHAYSLAAMYLRKSRATTDAQAEFFNRAGIDLARRNKLDTAIAYFNKALILKGDFFLARQNLQHAEGLLNARAPALAPPQFSEVYNQANHYFQNGDYQNAVDYYQKALKIFPSSPKAHNNIGVSYVNLGQHDRAVEHFEHAIALDPEIYEAYPNLALLMMEERRYAEVVQVIERALQIKEEPELYAMLAETYGKMGNVSKAKQCVELERKLRSKTSKFVAH